MIYIFNKTIIIYLFKSLHFQCNPSIVAFALCAPVCNCRVTERQGRIFLRPVDLALLKSTTKYHKLHLGMCLWDPTKRLVIGKLPLYNSIMLTHYVVVY